MPKIQADRRVSNGDGQEEVPGGADVSPGLCCPELLSPWLCVSCCGFYQSSQLCLLGLPAREKKTCQNTTPDISACKAGLWVMGLCAPLGLFPWGCSALMETSTEELQWVRRGCHGLYVCVRGCSYNTTSRMLRTTEVK